MSKILWCVGGVVALFVAAFWALYTPDTDAVEMQAKYGGPLAQYAPGVQYTQGGLNVHYRDQGNPDGEVLVLLHGSSASLHTWEPWVARLSDTYRIITLDLPGHGLTGPHPADDYTAAGMAEALTAVLKEAQIDEFILGGNSMGGWVTWRYALANKEGLKALILLDAAGIPVAEKAKGNIGFKIMGSSIGRYLAKSITPRSLVAKSLEQSVYITDIIDDAMVDRYWELLRYPGNRKATGIRAITPRQIERYKEIASITLPTLILWGREDALIPVTAAQAFKERLPNAQLVIFDGVGHLPMEEAPDETVAAMRQFLGGL